jgi:hypothetical protein
MSTTSAVEKQPLPARLHPGLKPSVSPPLFFTCRCVRNACEMSGSRGDPEKIRRGKALFEKGVGRVWNPLAAGAVGLMNLKSIRPMREKPVLARSPSSPEISEDRSHSRCASRGPSRDDCRHSSRADVNRLGENCRVAIGHRVLPRAIPCRSRAYHCNNARGSDTKVFEGLQRRVIVSVRRLSDEVGVSIPTVTTALRRIEELQIVREITGRKYGGCSPTKAARHSQRDRGVALLQPTYASALCKQHKADRAFANTRRQRQFRNCWGVEAMAD